MRKSILVIGVLAVLFIFGCTQNSQNNADKSGSNLPENQSIAESPDWTVQAASSETAVNELGDIQEETVGFAIYIPKDWTVVNMELYFTEEYLMAVYTFS